MKQNILALIDNLTHINKDAWMKVLEDAGVIEKDPISFQANYDDELTDRDIAFLQNNQLSRPIVLFNNGIKYKLENNTTFQEYITALNDLRNKLAAENKISSKSNPESVIPRRKYYKTIERIIDTLKTIKTGTGIRKYKQPKRNAYKISQNKYGV